MELSPGVLASLYASFVQKDAGPSPSIQLYGCCPSCGRDLMEVAAVDQQFTRRRCSCGSNLPTDWRWQFRHYLKTRAWLDQVPKFRRWVPASDVRPSCLPGIEADLQNRFTIRPMEFTADELAKAQRR